MKLLGNLFKRSNANMRVDNHRIFTELGNLIYAYIGVAKSILLFNYQDIGLG